MCHDRCWPRFVVSCLTVHLYGGSLDRTFIVQTGTNPDHNRPIRLGPDPNRPTRRGIFALLLLSVLLVLIVVFKVAEPLDNWVDWIALTSLRRGGW